MDKTLKVAKLSWICCAVCSVGIGAALVFAAPAQAGTCQPVTVKGHAKDPAAATTDAQIKLTQKLTQLGGGKVTQNSTDCAPIPGGFECKTKAVVCP
jgi:hypothetical protein